MRGEEGTSSRVASVSASRSPEHCSSDAPILVLDEPTAHLDSETAEEFVRDILSGADGRSVLLITHRPEGLDLVDEIVRLG